MEPTPVFTPDVELNMTFGGAPRPVVRVYEITNAGAPSTALLRGAAAEIATDSSPASAVLLRALVAVPGQVAATPVHAPV
jgi:hypothetical protein